MALIGSSKGPLFALKGTHRVEEIALGWGARFTNEIKKTLTMGSPGIPFYMDDDNDSLTAFLGAIKNVPPQIMGAINQLLRVAQGGARVSVDIALKYKWWLVAAGSLFVAGALIYRDGHLLWTRYANGNSAGAPSNDLPQMSTNETLSQMNVAVADQGDTACVVCECAVRSHLFIPCGHLALCGDCIQKLDRCPICRETGQKLKVHIP